jgi:succinate-semialdehyde dehydrogenase/glutarate-semialdehyde dehydrogenase
MYISTNPYTGQELARYNYIEGRELSALLAKMEAEREKNSLLLYVGERAAALHRLAALLRNQCEELALLITVEMGKPLAQARAEVEKSAAVCAYYAEKGAAFLAEEFINEAKPSPLKARIIRQPLGIILQIMPWNFPFWQVFRFAASALIAGNSIVLKHSPNVPQCALAIAELVAAATGSQYILCNVFASNAMIAKLIAAPQIRGVSFTGSQQAGAIIGSLAGNAVKKSILELGGSDAFIVNKDVDIAEVAQQAVFARLQNNGQTCIAAKRFIIHSDIVAEFVEQLQEKIGQLSLGAPTNEANYLSVLARPDLAEALRSQVEKSVSAGAKLLPCPVKMEDKKSKNSNKNANFFAPVLLTNVPAAAPAASEELFGPVFAVFAFQDTKAAIDLANASRFGLGATVWTNDAAEAAHIAERLEVGAVAINQLLKSDPRLPFGGVKDAGYGLELGRDGLLEFVNTKTICL